MKRSALTPDSRRRSYGRTLAAMTALWLLAAVFLTASASAAAPELLFQAPADDVKPGTGAGQLANPRGIVADPDTGHLYVVEPQNSRISEFTAWGTFVKAWGWDVAPEGAPGDTPSNEFEICTTSCQAGVEGNGVGQMNGSRGLALDANGDIYLHEAPLDESSKRVQKFSPSGQFLLMFGGGVNQGPTNPGNLCTAQHITEGDTCGAGASGTADGEFSNGSVGNYLTYNPKTNSVFVGDTDRIQEFDTEGAFKSKIDFEGDLAAFDGKSVYALAADPASGNLYLAFPDPGFLENQEDPNVYRLDPATATVSDVLEVAEPRAITVDTTGNVYVASTPDPVPNKKFLTSLILGFGPSGNPISGLEPEDHFGEVPFVNNVPSQAIIGLATNLCAGSEAPGNLYATYFASGSVSRFVSWGTPPIGCEPPPLRPPEIKAQYATSVGTDAAVLKAEINPRFWPDTTYYLQYGTSKCSEGGCTTAQPSPPGKSLTKKSVNGILATAGIFLAGLEPDTTYHYRFVTQSGGSEGEEVIGVGGKPGEPGAEGSFKTFPLASPADTDCSNQAFREGPGARLPDCRAYEMVSPLDKNNGDIVVAPDVAGFPTGFFAGAETGQRLTYSSIRSFGDPESAPYASQYLATRNPLGHPQQGWQTESLSVPMTRNILRSTPSFSTPYNAFTPDLCTAWLRTSFDPPLTADAVPGFANIYRRDNCGGGMFEALTTVEPPNFDPERSFEFEFQGASADASHEIFIVSDNLTEDAPPQPAECLAKGLGCKRRLYERVEGSEGLRFVCVLPNGNPTSKACSAGTLEQVTGINRLSNMRNAISADGQRIFWTESDFIGPGTIYVRFAEEPESRRVSQSVSNAKARFWGAAEDGTEAIFEVVDGGLADNLYRFDVEEDASTLIAEDVAGVMGISEDASRVYFASTQAIPDTGQNSEGDEAEPGEANLYLEEQGVGTRFVATLGSEGLLTSSNVIPTPYAPEPLLRISRVTPDGLHAAFMSTAPLTGYDNTDTLSGKPATEVFHYDAAANEGAGKLVCVSCNPTGARPTGRELINGRGNNTGVWAAAKIPGAERDLYFSRPLSADGTHVFFESYEALIPRDTNGAQDVYQWEELGAGSCDASDSGFEEKSGGCLELVSSGESPRDSAFVDASLTGDDVFFTTLSSLVPSDFGLVDVYDARVGGGFPEPTAKPICEGEACQGPVAAPDDPTPASSSFEGAGNLTEPRPLKCAKGRRAVKKAGRTRCAKKPRRAKRTKRANTTGRAAR